MQRPEVTARALQDLETLVRMDTTNPPGNEGPALAHVAECLPRLEALIVWESALRHGRASVTGLRRVAWSGRQARKHPPAAGPYLFDSAEI